MTDILSLTLPEVEALLTSWGQPRFRGKQVFTWLHRGTPFTNMSNLPAALRAKLEEECEWRLPQVECKQVSAADGTVKNALGMPNERQ